MDNLAPQLEPKCPEGLKATLQWILRDARRDPGAYLFETLVPGGGE